MTFTYTSAELAEIAASIPTRANEAGLLFVPGVTIDRECDVLLSSEEVDAEGAMRVAAHIGASFISVRANPFNVDSALAEFLDEDTESAESVKRLKKSAQPHDGTLERVTVSWAAQGLIYEWSAATAWIESFTEQLIAGIQDAEAESEAEREEHREEYRTAYKSALSALVSSPIYRGEQVGKRRNLVSKIFQEAGLEEMPDSFITNQVTPDANKIVGAKAYEYEQNFSTRISELADGLRYYPAWQRVNTKIKRKEAAAKFLMEKADGYRLSIGLAEEISEAAAVPSNIVRY